MDIELPVAIERQPDDTTCSPTRLHAGYAYLGDSIPLPEVIAGVHALEGGGTPSLRLAAHALRRLR